VHLAAETSKAAVERAEKFDTGSTELNNIKGNILQGQDGLGSVVHEVSKKNKHVDKFFHCLNPVGFAWADKKRVPVMAVTSVIGSVVGAFALCGALGLTDLVMETLPWGAMFDLNLPLPLAMQWICADTLLQPGGSRPSTAVDFGAATVSNNQSNCWFDGAQTSGMSYNATYGPGLSAFLDERNVELWTQFPRSPEMPDGALSWFASLAYANATGYALGVPIGSKISYTFNQWGMCLYPKDEWLQGAMQVGAKPNSGRIYWGENKAGTCRKWDSIGPWVPSSVQACQEGLGVDAFSLVMGAFGGVLKIVEPLSRMKKETDLHQKTVVLIIITISAIVPLIAVLKFNTACLVGLSDQFASQLGTKVYFGMGAISFLISVVLLIPIAVLHIIVPAGVNSSLDVVETEAKPVPVSSSSASVSTTTPRAVNTASSADTSSYA